MYKELLRNKMLIVMIGLVVCSGASKAETLKDCEDQCKIAVGQERFGNPHFHACKEMEMRKLAECTSRRETDVERGIRNTAECETLTGHCQDGMVTPKTLNDCLCNCEAKFPSKEDFGDFKVSPQGPCYKGEPSKVEGNPSDKSDEGNPSDN